MTKDILFSGLHLLGMEVLLYIGGICQTVMMNGFLLGLLQRASNQTMWLWVPGKSTFGG